MMILSSSGVSPSSWVTASARTPSSRRMRSESAVSTALNGVKTIRKSSRGRATRRASCSACSSV